MFVRCDLKRRVLESVCRLGMATSSDVAAGLRGVSGENVSMTLLKCKRQGLVDRDEYKRGRVRGYVYWVLDRGKRRLMYYHRRMKSNPTVGVVDVKRVVQDARADADLLYSFASCSVDTQGNGFEGRERLRRSFLWMNKERIVSSFASERLLRICSPQVWEAIREASGEVAPEDLIELHSIVNTNDAGSCGAVLPSDDAWLNLFVIKRVRELHDGQALLYQEWQRAKSENGRLERQLEEETRLRKDAEGRLDRVMIDLSLKLECHALSLHNECLASQSELCLACVQMLGNRN